MDVLDICTIARITIRSPAVGDMNMSPHRRTDKIAHHWCSIITPREFTTSQFETRAIWPINSPARLCHGSVAGFMFLLNVTFSISMTSISIQSSFKKSASPRGKVQK
jgi:hypothetical protein